MSIAVSCDACGKSFKTKDENAGRRAKCACGAVLTIPKAVPPPPPPPVESSPFDGDDDHGEYDLAAALPQHVAPPPPPPPNVTASQRGAARPSSSAVRSASSASASSSAMRARPPEAGMLQGSSGFCLSPRLRDHAYLLLLLAMVPLAISMLFSSRDGLPERLDRMLEGHPEIEERIEAAMSRPGASDEDFFDALPDHRVEGALHARDTSVHWIYALLSAVAFLGAAAFLFPKRSTTIRALALTGLFTGTLGILFLLGVQWVADWSQGYWVRGRGIVMLLFYIVKFIGFSYRAALGDTGFFLSFFGFTFGVGMCEEVCKALPVIWFLRRSDGTGGWRAACLWGFVSGAGFGVSEGIMYCSDYYNGLSGGEAYVVRFVSCVALHAVWTGAGAISLYRHQAKLDGESGWFGIAVTVGAILALPIVLHGLYDTLLKKDMPGLALLTAVASIAWLATRVEWGRKVEEDPTSGYAMA